MAYVRRTPVGRFSGLVLLLATVTFAAAPLRAAGRVRLMVGFGAGDMGGYMKDAWAPGIEYGILVNPWKTWGVHVICLSASGTEYGLMDGSLLADAGFWKSFGAGRAPTLVLFGFSMSAGTDIDGGDLDGVGGHAGLRQELWFGRNVGLYIRGVLRYFFGGSRAANDLAFAPSVGGGVTIRF